MTPSASPRQLLRLRRLPLRLRHVPLVRALEALPVLAARLVGFGLRPEVAALRARLLHRLVPDHEVAVLVRAGVERRTALARAALDDVATVFRTAHSRW